MFGEIGFHPFCEFAAGEHDAVFANFTFQSNIRAEADNCPFKGAAWMLFAQAQVIVEAKVGQHKQLSVGSDQWAVTIWNYTRHAALRQIEL
jgi:hypothetical protein